MRPSLLRKVATGVLLLDALAIGAAALQVDDVVTRTTTALPSVASAPAAPDSALDVSPAPPGAAAYLAPLGDPGDPFADALAQLGASSGTDKPPSDGAAPTVPPASATGDAPTGGPTPPCPLELDDAALRAAVTPILSPLSTGLGVLLAGGPESGTPLAAALAPFTQALTSNELGGCIVALQNMLLAASPSGAPSAPAATSIDLSALGLGGLR